MMTTHGAVQGCNGQALIDAKRQVIVRLDRFTMSGKIKVNIQWLLFCLIHNIEKIMNYGLAFA
jgi:hypothetical protein